MKIEDRLPDVMVQALFHSIGRMRYYPGEYHKNDLWIENGDGEGTSVPMPIVEKMLKELFDRYY